MEKLIFTFLLACTILFGCSSIKQESMSEVNLQQDVISPVQNTNNADALYFTEKDAGKSLKEIYSLEHLNRHEVYMIDDKMNIDLYFNDGIERKEIENSRIFIIKIFVVQATSKYGTPIPYQQLILSKVKWDKTSSRIFIDDIKVLEEKYSGNDIKYYENMDIELKSRIADHNLLQSFERSIKWQFWSIKDIAFEESYKGDILVIKVKGNKTYEAEDIDKLKALVENKLVQELGEASQKENANIRDYLGYVLQLYDGSKKYHEETYVSGTRKLWVSEDWMNYQFFYESSPE